MSDGRQIDKNQALQLIEEGEKDDEKGEMML